LKRNGPGLCPDCPLISHLPPVLAQHAHYTRDPTAPSNLKKCQLLRALQQERHMHFLTCPHYRASETLDHYLTVKSPDGRSLREDPDHGKTEAQAHR
jgi:hypothetical protein